MADVRPAPGPPDAARRGPDRDGLLRRDAVHGHPAAVPGARRGPRSADRPGAGTGLRHGPDRHPGAARRGVPATGQLDRRRPRRQPGRHRRDHPTDVADPRRSRPARIRGGRDAADADGRRGDDVGPGRPAARLASRPRRGGPARDRPPAAPALPGRALPPAVRVHRRAAAPHAGRARRRAGAIDRALRLGRRARGGARRGLRRARGRRPRPRRVRRGGRAALAGRDVRVLARLARGPPARGGPPGCAGGDPRGGAGNHGAVARRDPRRGPRHVPGDRRGPGAVRRRRLPSLHRQLHQRHLGRDRRARAGAPGRGSRPGVRRRRPRGAADPRRRPPVRVERGARGRRRDPRRAARRSGLPVRAGGPRRSPGGHARLLRFEQGVGAGGGGLDAPRSPVEPGRGGAGAGRGADPLPRPRRRARSRRRTRPTGRSSARRRAPWTGGSS